MHETRNEIWRPILFALLIFTGSCRPPKGAEVREPTPPAEPDMADAPGEELPDPTDPENLARAVFSALTLKDAAAYKALLPNSAGEAQELAQATGSSQVMTDDEIAAMLEKQEKRFNDFIALLESNGFDPGGAVLTGMDTHRAQVKDGFGFAEDMKFTMESAGKKAVITIDDCMLFKRGWLILDGLKLRDPIEGPGSGP